MTLEQALAAKQNTDQDCEVVGTGCLGLCSHGPLVRVESSLDAPVLYEEVTADLAKQIIDHHIPPNDGETSDKTVKPHDFLHRRSSGNQAKGLLQHVLSLDAPFFTKQVRVVLSETGQIDPESLDDYLAHGGYQALAQVLGEMTPEQVSDEILREWLTRTRRGWFSYRN